MPKIKIASAIVQIKQANIELTKNMGCLIDEMPAINGIKGLIAGINLPIRIPTHPYLLKKFSPLIKISSLFFKTFKFLNFGPKKSPQ